MAWNPHPEVAALREYSKAFDRPVVVAFSLYPDGNRFNVTTFGKSKKLCRLAAAFGEEIARLVREGTLLPPQQDPGPTPIASSWVRDPNSPLETA